MILESKKTDFEFKVGEMYFGFGLFINLYLNNNKNKIKYNLLYI